MHQINPTVLALEDGSIYQGWSYGKLNTVIGEVVFNTGMTGYQEILTDPSYYKQIIIFTYPELGNTGINLIDTESSGPHVKGIVVKNLCKLPSNWRSKGSLFEYLQLHNIMCIYGINTRKLTQHLRQLGSMNGAISNKKIDPEVLLQKVRSTFSMQGADLASNVTTKKIYSYNLQVSIVNRWYFQSTTYNKNCKILKIAVIDFGLKTNILKRLQSFNCETIVVPATTPANIIMTYKPDGILLSNGPGDPSAVSYSIKTIQDLLSYNIPIFGICMGHQLLSIALGCNTYKLKFGHRGLNHPTGWSHKVQITSQNHGFAVNNQHSSNTLKTLHVNLNDNTIAGLSHVKLPVFSVQYHPEASPGPHDTDYLFAYFISMIYQYINQSG